MQHVHKSSSKFVLSVNIFLNAPHCNLLHLTYMYIIVKTKQIKMYSSLTTNILKGQFVHSGESGMECVFILKCLSGFCSDDCKKKSDRLLLT